MRDFRDWPNLMIRYKFNVFLNTAKGVTVVGIISADIENFCGKRLTYLRTQLIIGQ